MNLHLLLFHLSLGKKSTCFNFLLGKIQIASLAKNLVSLIILSSTLFFTTRIGNEKDLHPDMILKAIIGIISIIPLVFNITNLCLLALSHQSFVFISVTFVFLINAIPGFFLMFRKVDILRCLYPMDDIWDKPYRQDINSAFTTSILTSWIFNTLVVHESLFYIFYFTSKVIYMVFATIIFAKNNSLSRSLILCRLEKNYPEDFFPRDQTIFGPVVNPGSNETVTRIRICNESENPNDFLLKCLLPFYVVISILTMFAFPLLKYLATYQNLANCARKVSFKTRLFHYLENYQTVPLTVLCNSIKVINRQDPVDGESMMHKIVRENLLNSFQLRVLVEFGGDLFLRDKNGNRPLDFLEANEADIFQSMVRVGKPVPQIQRLMHEAVKNNQPRLLSFLLVLGAQPKSRDSQGRSVLDLVNEKIRAGNTEDINIWLKFMGKKKIVTLIFNALHSEDYELLDSLLKATGMRKKLYNRETGETLLTSIIKKVPSVKNVTTLINHLLDNGFDLNEPDNTESKTSPIHCASKLKSPDVLKLLLENYADVNQKTPNEKMTSLHFAASFGNQECLQCLLDNKADPNLTDLEDWTPLIHATFQGHWKCVQVLLEHAADPNFVTNLFWSRACLDLCSSLLKYEVFHNWSALLFAAKYGRKECIELLLHYGADPNYGNFEGTPLAIATKYNHFESANVIRKALTS